VLFIILTQLFSEASEFFQFLSTISNLKFLTGTERVQRYPNNDKNFLSGMFYKRD